MKLEMYEQISNHEQAGPSSSLCSSIRYKSENSAGNEARRASYLGVVFDDYSDRFLLYY